MLACEGYGAGERAARVGEGIVNYAPEGIPTFF